MKKQLPGFAAGVLTAALIGSLGITALAAAGGVTFNASALRLNGTQISGAGENYTLANGQSVPASITYTDKKGGGTTYLPVRRISELLGVETGWDGAGGAVTIGEEPAPTAPSDSYSDWTAEEEKAYQEFKGVWEQDSKNNFFSKDSATASLPVICTDVQTIKELCTKFGQEQMRAFSLRYSNEISLEYQEEYVVHVFYNIGKSGGWTDSFFSSGNGISSLTSKGIDCL